MPKTLAEKVRLIRHKSPAHCFGRFYHLSAAMVVKGEVGGIPVHKAIAGMERQQFWGFSDPKRLTIHFWIGPGARRKNLAMFFGHELGHIYEDRSKLRRRPQWMPASEWKADAWGEVARRAMSLALKYAKR